MGGCLRRGNEYVYTEVLLSSSVVSAHSGRWLHPLGCDMVSGTHDHKLLNAV